MMVVKVTVEQLSQLLLGEVRKPMTSAYFTGSWVEKFSEGRLVLSVKRGKRRSLLRGWVVCVSFESSQVSSGYQVLQFVPNDSVRAGRLYRVSAGIGTE